MKEIIVDSSLNQTRVALMENRELVELYIERDNNKRTVGNIYKGRVVNVLPGMQAAFVDIGFEKNAFLFIKDIVHTKKVENRDISIKDVIKSGQEIMIQIVKEPMGTKGARVTTYLTLPGRYLVLMPYENYVGISRRITNEGERDRLKKIIEEIKPHDMGIIVRTAAEGIEEKELKEDLKFLLKLWQKIDQEKNLGFPPRMIYKDLDLLQRTMRDIFINDIHQLIVNDKEKYKEMIDFIDLLSPHLKNRIEYFDLDMNIFDYYHIESMIKKAIERRVWLKSGGYLIIDETEALTVIDVNTGKYVGNKDLEDTVLKINREAAKEIAKQLRLRDIGGIIIVDFIDMNSHDGEKEVLKILEKELEKDRTKTNVLGITQLGLLEMTRKKVRERIDCILQKKCPYCEGKGRVLSEYTVIQNIEKEVKRIVVHTNAEAILIEVNPCVEDILNEEERRFLNELEELLDIKLFIRGVDTVHASQLKVKAIGKKDKILNIIANY